MINQIEDILRDIRDLIEEKKDLRQIEASKLLLESLSGSYQKLSEKDTLIDAVLDMMDIAMVVSNFLNEALFHLNIAELESGFDKDIEVSLSRLKKFTEKLQLIKKESENLLENQKHVEEKEKEIFLFEQKIKRLQLLVEKHKNRDIKSLENQLKVLEARSGSEIAEMERLSKCLNRHFKENSQISKNMDNDKLNELSKEIEEKLKIFDNELKEKLESKELSLNEVRKLNGKR